MARQPDVVEVCQPNTLQNTRGAGQMLITLNATAVTRHSLSIWGSAEISFLSAFDHQQSLYNDVGEHLESRVMIRESCSLDCARSTRTTSSCSACYRVHHKDAPDLPMCHPHQNAAICCCGTRTRQRLCTKQRPLQPHVLGFCHSQKQTNLCYFSHGLPQRLPRSHSPPTLVVFRFT